MTRSLKTILLLSFLGWLSLSAVESDPARRAWMKGYEAMTQADKALETQADLAALHGYEKALGVFCDVQSKFPGWNVSLINYRIEYCQKKIKEIKDANRANVEYLSKDDLLAQLAQQANDVQTLKDTLTAREKEISKMNQALERARAEAASLAVSEENFQLMKKDRDTLSAQVRSLASQVSDLKEELSQSTATENGRKRMAELEAQLKRSQEELANTSREMERIDTARNELLQQTQRDAKWRKDAEAQLAELKRVAQSARQQQEESETRVMQLQATIKRLEASHSIDETLPKDVQQLQAQLLSQNDKLQSAQMELLSLQRKLSQAEEAATSLGQELNDERLKTNSSTAAVSEELDNARKLRQKNAELTDQNERMEKTIASQKELLASLENTAAAKEKELNDCLKKLEAAMAAQKNLLERLNQIDSSSMAASGLADTAAELQTELATAQQYIQNLINEREKLSARLTTTEGSLRNASQRLNEVAENAQDAGSRILQDRINELQQELQNATNRINDLENALVKRDLANKSLEKALTDKNESDPQGNAAQSLIPNGNGIGQETGGLSPTEQVIVKGFLRQGIDAEKNGKIEAAQWNYRQALSMQPDNFLALKRLGLLASSAGNDAEAAQFLSTATKCNPDDCEVLLALGFAQLQLKQATWALANLSRAAALKPKDSLTARLFGVALGAMEWREAAMIQLQKALELNAKDSEAAINLAMIALTRASEIEFQARKDAENRTALERLAASIRHQALDWYHLATANGAQEDPMLEEALSK